MSTLDMFSCRESLRDSDYVLASYFCSGCNENEVVNKAKKFAIGQTVGTWVDIPTITKAMTLRHCAKIVDIVKAPPDDLKTGDELSSYFITLAFPAVNFGNSISILLTALLGNDASTSAQLKLVNLEFPNSFLQALDGPKFGIQGIRELTGEIKRPLVLNMIKPCIGLSPEEGAEIFYQTALGGVDIIKDDELLGDTSFSPLKERVKAFSAASLQAQKTTGKKTLYAVNITGQTDKMFDNIKIAEDYGADLIMVNYAVCGYDTMRAVSKSTSLPVVGHYAGSGFWAEYSISGISSDLINGTLPRLCGSDIALINTPYGNYPTSINSYFKTAHKLSCELPYIKNSFAAVGGGVHPGMTKRFVDDLGYDIVLASGGAIQGHPMGATLGAKAMVESAFLSAENCLTESEISNHPELEAAISLWGMVK